MAEAVVPFPVCLVVLVAAGVIDTLVDLGVATQLRLVSDTGLIEAIGPTCRCWEGGLAGRRAGWI